MFPSPVMLDLKEQEVHSVSARQIMHGVPSYPPNLYNGYIVQPPSPNGRYLKGNVVTFHCNPGFIFDDLITEHANHTCVDNNSWDPPSQQFICVDSNILNVYT